MNFWKHFVWLLPWRPGQALTALYWQLTRRRVRARNVLGRNNEGLPFAYDLWIGGKEEQEPRPTEMVAILAGLKWQPSITVVIYGRGGDDHLRARSRASVEAQAYPHVSVTDCDARDLLQAVREAPGDLVLPLRSGHLLSRSALFRVAEHLANHSDAGVLYGDQDEIGGRGRRKHPWLKPRWNAEMFLALDYLSACVAIRSDIARAAADAVAESPTCPLDDLLLKATAGPRVQVSHVPHILCHVPEGESLAAQDGRLEAVARHVAPLGAQCRPGPFGTVKVDWPLPADPPLVSIIIPTRDKVELLRTCVESVTTRTRYARYELLIVDNGSTEPDTLAYLQELSARADIRVLVDNRPYNYSAINNEAAHAAAGDYLCLLNNDTEVIAPGWMSEMVSYAIRDQVGAVGAKLLYPDNTIQHAGVAVGLGDAAGHSHRGCPDDQPGYFRQPHVAQFATAVTAACMIVEKRKFEAVGGLDEAQLSIAYNDVDLCLKLRAAGWHNVYTPHAVLYHHESKSRGNDLSPQHRERYMRELHILQQRWGTKDFADPLHHPDLDRYNETFVFRL